MIDAYKDLDIRIQKWVFKQGWPNLREIQAKAVKPILAGNTDVLISASTAAGKTEAFFLPACTAIARQEQGFGILYVSPLKALINDQYRRLEGLCETLDLQVTPWHGDSSQSNKKKAKASPSGILLITPESLESLMVRESGWVKKAFSQLQYVCIDEFHAFIGTERGQQLLSLLNRLEHLLDRYGNPIPRVALSATLGDLESVPVSLRPNKSMPCTILTSSRNESTLKVQVKGYIDPSNLIGSENLRNAEYQICEEIYQRCRGGNHLVFANSRNRTEMLAAQLTDFCEHDFVPNEFFPHHGSLAKELREELESRLQKENLPTTAICTMTLELGIDIGKVNSVVQVTAPHSVSSLRQRVGRSGRRQDPAILRMLIAEPELTSMSHFVDKFRLELLQSLAMIRLLIVGKWFEPADTKQMHLSTFLHQILSVIAQWGSIRADQLFSLLCDHGPFKQISVDHFKEILKHLGATDLLQQLHSGELVLGREGERLVNSYTFYAVFSTPEEFRVIAGSKSLGTLPVDSPVVKDQHIVFGGKRWKVIDIDDLKKVIFVTAAKGGKAPTFSGSGISIHDVVRQEMYRIYVEGDYRIEVGPQKVDFIDDTARNLFQEGLGFFRKSGLSDSSFVEDGRGCFIFPWRGDKIVNTLANILIRAGLKCSTFAGVVEVEDASAETTKGILLDVSKSSSLSDVELANALSASQKRIDKYDEFLPESVLSEGFGRRVFDVKNTLNWISQTIK
jgi:ATP-dependent Lhr-like helicase